MPKICPPLVRERRGGADSHYGGCQKQQVLIYDTITVVIGCSKRIGYLSILLPSILRSRAFHLPHYQPAPLWHLPMHELGYDKARDATAQKLYGLQDAFSCIGTGEVFLLRPRHTWGVINSSENPAIHPRNRKNWNQWTESIEIHILYVSSFRSHGKSRNRRQAILKLSDYNGNHLSRGSRLARSIKTVATHVGPVKTMATHGSCWKRPPQCPPFLTGNN